MDDYCTAEQSYLHINNYKDFLKFTEEIKLDIDLQRTWKSFMAKRITNDFFGHLNRYNIDKRDISSVIDTGVFSYITFLYFRKIIDKKLYVKILDRECDSYTNTVNP